MKTYNTCRTNIDIIPIFKACTLCNILKPVKEFTKSKNKIGLRSSCKSCEAKKEKIFREKNRDRLNAQNKEYYRTHKKETAERQKQYRKDNPELIKEQYENNRENILAKRKIWRETHKEEHRDEQKRYREKHKEEIEERRKQWIKDNPEKVKTKRIQQNKRDRIKRAEKRTIREAKEKAYYEEHKEEIEEKKIVRKIELEKIRKKKDKEYYELHKQELLAQQKSYKKNQSLNLDDIYIKRKLYDKYGIKRSNMSDGLVEFQRTILIAKRELRKHKKNKNSLTRMSG